MSKGNSKGKHNLTIKEQKERKKEKLKQKEVGKFADKFE
jgi:hypothetical protein